MTGKVVVRLNWSSLDGRAEFRPVYDDGSVGFVVQTEIETSDPHAIEKMDRIEKKWIGRRVE